MTAGATILDGNALAQKLQDSLKDDVARLRRAYGSVPRLVNIMIGHEPSACAYARSQQKVAEYIGIRYHLENLPAHITQKDLVTFVQKLDADGGIHGMMLHKPVPAHIDYRVVGNQISPVKDMEGVNVTNIGKMILGETRIIPCTPAAVMEHIRSTGIALRGQEAVVVGHSEIVGRPLSMLLLAEYATVTVCHIATSEAGRLTEHIRRADILVVAVGKPALVKGDWVKEGAVVIDVGINKVGAKIVGDVEFASARRRASFLTPVPGGVGPVTVVMLMRNGIEAFKLQKEMGL